MPMMKDPRMSKIPKQEPSLVRSNVSYVPNKDGVDKHFFEMTVDDIIDQEDGMKGDKKQKRSHNKKSICDQCGSAFASVGNLNRHVRVAHLRIRVYCDFKGCSQDFSQTADLTRHLRRVHHMDTDLIHRVKDRK